MDSAMTLNRMQSLPKIMARYGSICSKVSPKDFNITLTYVTYVCALRRKGSPFHGSRAHQCAQRVFLPQADPKVANRSGDSCLIAQA